MRRQSAAEAVRLVAKQVSSLCNVQPTPDLQVYVEPSTRSCSSNPPAMFCREP